MRAALAFVALAGCSAAPTQGGGVVSTNPCADAMLVRLVPPSRVAAISWYSQAPGATSMPLAVARRFRATAGTAEEVIALRPSLVLTSSFTPPATREAYARAGLRTLVLDSPATVAASEAQVREVAAAVVERARGEAMVREIEGATREGAPSPSGTVVRAVGATYGTQATRTAGPRDEPGVTGIVRHAGLVPASSLPQVFPSKDHQVVSPRSPSTTRPSALLFLSGDLATGPGTLLDELLTRAGFRNAAAAYGLRFTGRVPIEAIAAHPPDVILAPDAGRAAVLRRRVLARLGTRTVEATFPRELVNCGGPTIPRAMARLRAVRAALR